MCGVMVDLFVKGMHFSSKMHIYFICSVSYSYLVMMSMFE